MENIRRELSKIKTFGQLVDNTIHHLGEMEHRILELEEKYRIMYASTYPRYPKKRLDKVKLQVNKLKTQRNRLINLLKKYAEQDLIAQKDLDKKLRGIGEY